jgi:hypothetical protein
VEYVRPWVTALKHEEFVAEKETLEKLPGTPEY